MDASKKILPGKIHADHIHLGEQAKHAAFPSSFMVPVRNRAGAMTEFAECIFCHSCISRRAWMESGKGFDQCPVCGGRASVDEEPKAL